MDRLQSLVLRIRSRWYLAIPLVVVYKLTEDWMLDWARQRIAERSGSVIAAALRIFLEYLPLITWAAIVILGVLAILFPERSRGTITPPPVAPSTGAPKGFLDFIVDSKKSADHLNKIMSELSTETTRIGNQIQAHTRRLLTKGITPERAHTVVSAAAIDMDNYSEFLERTLVSLRATGDVFGQSLVGYLEQLPTASESDRTALDGFRNTARTLLQSIKTSGTSVEGFRASIAELRRRNVSQSLNRASERLTTALDGVLAFIRTLEKTIAKLIGVVNRKLRPPS